MIMMIMMIMMIIIKIIIITTTTTATTTKIAINDGNRTEWSPIRPVVTRVISICDRIGRRAIKD